MMRNSKIVNIRALAIIIVVLGHSIILYSKSWGFFESIYDVPILNYLKSFINIIQMPLFFSLSGFLFYYSINKKSDFKNFFKKKFKRPLADYFKQQAVTERVIFAFTMSPQPVIAAYEHFTPDMQARIACAAEAVQRGFSVRLAFDPMIYCKDWENVYAEMLQCVDEQIDWKRLVDVSVGSFRLSLIHI